MADEGAGRADWQGVGESFRTLGRRLREHAVAAGGAISDANDAADGGVADQVGSAFKAAVAKLDETTTDPQVGAATRDATGRLLDAIKAELTGGARPSDQEVPRDPGPTEPEPPRPVEPGPSA